MEEIEDSETGEGEAGAATERKSETRSESVRRE